LRRFWRAKKGTRGEPGHGMQPIEITTDISLYRSVFRLANGQ
jgi:hypothetical protein